MQVHYMLDSKPLLNSDHLGWDHIKFSRWNRLAPQEGYILSMPHYLITVNMTPEPFRAVSRFEGSDHERVKKTGDIDFYLPGNFHYFRWEQVEASYSCIMLSHSLVQQTANQAEVNLSASDLNNKLGMFDSRIFQLSEWLFDEINSNGARGKLYLDSLSNLLAFHLLEMFLTKPQKPLIVPGNLSEQQLSRVIEYMHVHLDRDISLKELAAEVNISQTHLVRLFKQTTGFSPYQYFIRLRIDKAKSLIRSREFTIGEVAATLGFADQSHMNRHFKRITGLSPKEYWSI